MPAVAATPTPYLKQRYLCSHHRHHCSLSTRFRGQQELVTPCRSDVQAERAISRVEITMAMKLGRPTSFRPIWKSALANSNRYATRQLSCTTLRAKDVASQDETPNLRHAPRPRIPPDFSPPSLASANPTFSRWATPCSRCQPYRQVRRESHIPPHLRSISPLRSPKICPAILGLEG